MFSLSFWDFRSGAVRGLAAASLSVALMASASAQTGKAKLVEKASRPLLEMTFVLDTTGSMGGLIEGAKQRIWGIVNEMLATTAEKRPEIRIALVAYRDKGDEYVTKVLPLTNDLDKVYATLMDFQAGGGGDTPEDVRQALADGLNKVNWTPNTVTNRKVARILFLVGDAPPHDDYQDAPDTLLTATKAISRGIYVNAIQCGNIEGTRPAWQRIATRGEGKFFAIAQDGGVEVIPTPYDVELTRLGGKIGTTYMAYGGSGMAGGAAAFQAHNLTRSVSLESKVSRAAAAAPSASYAAADRAVNKAVNVYAYDANSDIVTAIEAGATTFDKVKKDDLPVALQKLPVAEQKKAVEKKVAERKEVRAQILTLSKKRDSYLTAERKKRAAASGKSAGGFDSAVAETLKTQVARRGITL